MNASNNEEKHYEASTVPPQTSDDIKNKLIDNEYKKPMFFVFAFIFLVAAFAFAFLGQNEQKEIILEIPDTITFKGGLAALCLVIAGFCIWLANPKFIIKSK